MPPLLATVRSRLPRLVRAGALLMFIGALSAAVSLPASLTPDEWAPVQQCRQLRSRPGLCPGPRPVLVLRADRPAVPQPPAQHLQQEQIRNGTRRSCPQRCDDPSPNRLRRRRSQRTNLKVTSWKGRSTSSAESRPAVTPGAATGRSSRSTAWTPRDVEVGFHRAGRPLPQGFVQAHDHVAGAVLRQLDRLDDQAGAGHREQRFHAMGPLTIRGARLVR